VGRPRKLPVVEAGTRENAFEPSNGGRDRGRDSAYEGVLMSEEVKS